METQTLRIDCEENVNFPDEARIVFEQLFSGYERIILKQELQGNLSGSRVFVVRPMAGNRGELPVVVKLASTHLVKKEMRAFECVKMSLYGLVKIQRTALPAGGTWGGLLYPFEGGGQFQVESLYDYCRRVDTDQALKALERLFKSLKSIHDSHDSRAEFPWKASYDPILPLNLWIEPGTPPPGEPVEVLNAETCRQTGWQPGMWIRLEGFGVTKTDLRAQTATLNLLNSEEFPSRSFCVRLKPITDFSPFEMHDPETGGFAVPPGLATGRIKETRTGQLSAQIQKWIENPQTCFDSTALLEFPDRLERFRDVKVALIHGDLNLNNILVDSDAGHVSLIDVAEARQDHILHDFLRLETEVITKLLPPILQGAGLEPGSTLSKFYPQVHCAAFGDPHFEPALPHPELEKPLALLRAIRQQAKGYFYQSDNTAEYYQGLLLYLIGALKFNNLEKLPGAKPAALWAAMAVLTGLKHSENCPELAAATAALRSPDAVIVDCRPEVWVRNRQSHHSKAANIGTWLYHGDTVSTYENAEAKIHCRHEEQVFRIDEGRNEVINCQLITRKPIGRLRSHFKTEAARLVEALSSLFIWDQGAPPALLLAPRNTVLWESRPTFYWQAVEGAAGYRLSLRLSRGRSWSGNTRDTLRFYPDELPSLEPGSGIAVVLEVLGTDLPPEITHLRRLTDSEWEQVKAMEAEIRALPLSPAAQHHALAHGYQSWGLRDAAIQELEMLIQKAMPVPPEIWLQLGTLNLQKGLDERAGQYYRAALEAAQPGQAQLERDLAHLGLACVHYLRNELTEANRQLDATTPEAPQGLVKTLRRRLLPDPAGLSVYGGPPDLSSFVRFTSENLAPHLKPELQKIPDPFLRRLKRELEKLTLKPNFTQALAPLGSNELEPLELLAATYITTHELIRTLSHKEGEPFPQSTELVLTLQNQARQIAETKVGLSQARAEDFALQYTALMRNNVETLRQLVQVEKETREKGS